MDNMIGYLVLRAVMVLIICNSRFEFYVIDGDTGLAVCTRIIPGLVDL